MSYNNVRLNRAVGYITPKDMLAGRQKEIQAERDQKLEAAPETTADSSPASRLTDRKHHVERAVSSINTITSSFDLFLWYPER